MQDVTVANEALVHVILRVEVRPPSSSRYSALRHLDTHTPKKLASSKGLRAASQASEMHLRTLPHIVIACSAVRTGLLLAERSKAKRTSTSIARNDSGPDYRLVALGSMLPDILDRTVHNRLFPHVYQGNEHIFGHTLALNLLLLILGILPARRGDANLLSFAVASLSHVLVDPVIRAPRTLLWPLLGLRFHHTSGWGATNTVVTQAAAGLITCFAAYRLWQQKRLLRFLSKGRL